MLALILQGKPITELGKSSGGTLQNLWMAAHTADPTGLGQDAYELTSTSGYTRVAATRSTNGWVVSGHDPAAASPSTTIPFPWLTDNVTHTITFFSIGSSSSGPGQIFYSGAILPPAVLRLNNALQLSMQTSITEE